MQTESKLNTADPGIFVMTRMHGVYYLHMVRNMEKRLLQEWLAFSFVLSLETLGGV